MNFHHRPLSIFEQVLAEIAACASTDKRLHYIELSHTEHKEFVALANNVLGIHDLEQLQRGFFKGIALKVITDTPNIFEVKDAIIDAVTPPFPPTEKVGKVLKAIRERNEKKGTK